MDRDIPVQLKKKKKFRGAKFGMQELHLITPEEISRRIEQQKQARVNKNVGRRLARQRRREQRHYQIPFRKSNEINMENWYGSHQELAGSHHRSPKRTLGWIHSKMTPEQIKKRNRALDLPEEAGATALARLRSNLIPWGPHKVASDTRSDDPEHTGESLDMVKDRRGLHTPRSKAYSEMAFTYDRIRKRMEHTGANKMRDREAELLTQHMLQAEMHHYASEKDPQMPADYGGDFWQKNGQQDRPWKKGRVPFGTYPTTTNPSEYKHMKALEAEQARQAREEARNRQAEQEEIRRRTPHWGPYAYLPKSARFW